MRRFRKFLGLSYREKLFLVKAVLLVLAVRLGLTLLSFSTLQDYLRKGARTQNDSTQRFSVDQVAWSVAAASRFIPKATCLVQALTLDYLLHREGYSANLQIGVTKGEKEELQAHAWVESGGRVINDGPGFDIYKPLKYERNAG